MGAKNTDLCESAYCRERWSFLIAGSYWRRSWDLRLCARHAQPYRAAGGADSVGRTISVRPRP